MRHPDFYQRRVVMNKAKWPAFWFLLPAALLFVIFFYWPLLQNLYLSFFSWNMISPTMKYVGLSNYIDILGSKEVYKIIGNTVIFVLIMLLFNFVLPYLYSFILGHLLQRGKCFIALFCFCRQLYPWRWQAFCSCGSIILWPDRSV